MLQQIEIWLSILIIIVGILATRIIRIVGTHVDNLAGLWQQRFIGTQVGSTTLVAVIAQNVSLQRRRWHTIDDDTSLTGTG